MSGHSKWSKIKRGKADLDAKRGKMFSKFAREIITAVKIGGEDVGMNSRLRLAVQKAKEANMPNDTIKRAIQKGVGNDEDSRYEEVTYEAYGPHGVALMIETLTNNKHRTAPNLKFILGKNNGTLATVGAVAYLFSKQAVFGFKAGEDENKIMEVATEGGATDIQTHSDGSIEVTAPPAQFEALKTLFGQHKLPPESADIAQNAQTKVSLDLQQAKDILKLVDALDDDDDVQAVFGNFEIDDAVLKQLD